MCLTLPSGEIPFYSKIVPVWRRKIELTVPVVTMKGIHFNVNSCGKSTFSE